MGAADWQQNIKFVLAEIRKTADRALDGAQAAGVKGAINWGDLSVVETRFCIDEEGERSYEVLIEEASPGSSELIRHVLSELEALGLQWPVEVRTEW